MSIREDILEFVPANPQEVRDQALLLQWLDAGVEVFTRENQTAHFTASAWVISPDRTKVLMAYHNLYNSWAWLGGHADGEQDLKAVACREVKEESGLQELTLLSEKPISLEILCVDGHEKRGNYVSSHLHLNVTYLFEADPEAPLRCKPDENSAVAWIKVEDIAEKCTEPWFVARIYEKLIQRGMACPPQP